MFIINNNYFNNKFISTYYFTNNCNEANTSQFPENTVLYSSDIVITVPKGKNTYIILNSKAEKKVTFDVKQQKVEPSKCQLLENAWSASLKAP